MGPTLPNYRSEVPVYLAMPELGNFIAFGMIDNYDARMGGGRMDLAAAPPQDPVGCEQLTSAQAAKAIQTGRGCATPAEQAKLPTRKDVEVEEARTHLMWARIFGVTGEQQPGAQPSLSFGAPMLNGKGPQFSVSYGGFQAGMDLWRGALYGGRDDAGLYVGYANAYASVDQVYSTLKAGSVTMNAYSVGAYGTHFAPQGWWLDGVLQGTWLGNVQGSTQNTGMTVSGSAFTASLEGGYPFRLAPAWSIEPQGQLIYQYLQMNTGSDAYGITSFGDTDDVRRGSARRWRMSRRAASPACGQRRSGAASTSGTISSARRRRPRSRRCLAGIRRRWTERSARPGGRSSSASTRT